MAGTRPTGERGTTLLAARRDPRVRAVVAISTYDYDRGRGTRRASALARLIFSLNDVPVLGGTVARLRQYPIVKAVFDGGLHRLGRERYGRIDRPVLLLYGNHDWSRPDERAETARPGDAGRRSFLQVMEVPFLMP
jgi:pimeloyl-ACP methyl ester carboxylesterase